MLVGHLLEFKKIVKKNSGLFWRFAKVNFDNSLYFEINWIG